jgi:cobalamin biosynthesis protein CobT
MEILNERQNKSEEEEEEESEEEKKPTKRRAAKKEKDSGSEDDFEPAEKKGKKAVSLRLSSVAFRPFNSTFIEFGYFEKCKSLLQSEPVGLDIPKLVR